MRFWDPKLSTFTSFLSMKGIFLLYQYTHLDGFSLHRPNTTGTKQSCLETSNSMSQNKHFLLINELCHIIYYSHGNLINSFPTHKIGLIVLTF